MTWQELRQNFISNLSEVVDEREATQWFWLWLEHVKGWNRLKYEWNRQESATSDDLQLFESDLTRLTWGEPIQHVIGTVEFAGVSIQVNKNVLIPRPETEEMVERAAAEFNGQRILDLCTGSGCISIALAARFPNAVVTGVELSEAALEYAKSNAELNQVKVQWQRGDVLAEPMDLPMQDLIISNPPYIHPSERSTMERRVTEFDPSMALFVTNDDVQQFYKAMEPWLNKLLRPGGIFWFETHRDFADDTAEIFKNNPSFCDIEVVNDFIGNPRFVKGKKCD